MNMLKYHDDRQWGLHAAQARKKGDFIGPYVGEVLSGQEGLRQKQAKIATSPSYLLQLGSCYIDAEHYGNATRFINHVCVAPNCRYEYSWVQGRLHIAVTATRDIAQGEEYTTAYGFARKRGSACHCGHEHCQGHMGEEVVRHPVTERRLKRTLQTTPAEWTVSAQDVTNRGPEAGVTKPRREVSSKWTAMQQQCRS